MVFHFREESTHVRLLELTPSLRRQIEATIEHLVSLLDAYDGDENFEENGDLEPSLGWTDRGTAALHLKAANDDCELDDSDYENGADDEPSFGWTVDGEAGLTYETDEREDDGDVFHNLGFTSEAVQ